METCDRCKHNAYMVFYTGTETEKLCVFCTRELLPKVFARVRELEELVRWRKWPEEKPEVNGQYEVLRLHYGAKDFTIQNSLFNPEINQHGGHVFFWSVSSVDYWRPIGPMPTQEVRG